MLTYFVLTLYCLTCQPAQVFSIHDIPAFAAGSAVWADHYCQEMGDILSGDYERRNIKEASLGGLKASKQTILYTCQRESGEF